MRRRFDLRRNDGVAMTEFALILPVFILIVLGLLAFGRIFFYWIQANHVANETARWAVVDRNPYTGKTLQQAAADSSTIEFRNGAKVCIEFPDPEDPSKLQAELAAERGDPVRVRVERPFRLRIRVPLMDPIDMGVTVRGTSTMRIETFANGAGDPQTYHVADNLPSGAC